VSPQPSRVLREAPSRMGTVAEAVSEIPAVVKSDSPNAHRAQNPRMNSAARLIAVVVAVVVAVAAAIGGAMYWKTHRFQPAVAPLATSKPAPSELESAIAAATAAPATSPEQPESTRADVAARVEAAYNASKAKAEAEKLATE